MNWKEHGIPRALKGLFSAPAFTRLIFPLFLVVSILFPLSSALCAQTELGSEDDLTVLGADGTVPDPDAEIKGFTVFGSTNLLTHISTAPGNVVINGALEVSSDVYIVGVASAAKFYGNGSGLTGITGDNLGNHTATQALNMSAMDIVGVSTLTVSSITTNAAAITISTNLFVVNGNVSIGTFPATARLHVQDSANQLRLGYSSDKYAAFSMDSNAILTLTPWTAGGQGIVKFASPGYFTMAFTQGKTITSTAGGITIGNGNDLVIEGNSGKLKLGKAGGGAPAEIYADQSGSTNDVLFDTVGGRLKLLIAGTERARIDLVGQMGVGTTVPAARLHISSPNAAAADTILQVSSGASPGQELLVVKGDGNVGISSATPMYRLVVSSGAGEAGTIMAVSTGSSNLFWVAGDGAHAVKYWGDGSGLSGISGDNLGNHTATTDLSIAGFDIINASSITVAANKPGLTVSTHLLVMNGNVGIGTTGPGTKLSVRVDGNGANAVLRLSSILADWNIGNGPRLLFNGGTDDRSFGEIGSFLQDTGSGANAYMAFSTRDSEAVAERVRITSNGSVGIGTTTPRAKLHISGGDGADSFSAATIALGYAGTAEYPHFIHTRHNAGGSTGNAIDFYTGDTTAAGVFPTNAVLGMTINNGNIGIGTTVPGSKLEVVGGSITIRGSDSNLAIAGFTDAGGNYRVVISTAGNVGIGTISPDAPLSISGGQYATALTVTSAGEGSNTGIVVRNGDGTKSIKLDSQNGMVRLDGTYAYTEANRLTTANYAALRLHTANTNKWNIGLLDSTDNLLVTDDTGNKIITVIDNGTTANVGIGTTGPLSKFDVFDGSITVRGTNAGLVLENASRVISPETSAALGAGVKVSTNVYIVGFTSATKYFGDGSSLTGITAPGDNLGNHTATAVLQMGAYGVNTSSDITAARYQIAGSTVLFAEGGNLGIGFGAGQVNVGGNNAFIGYQAGVANTSGGGNVFVGYQTGALNNTGLSNSFMGYQAGYGNTTGSWNTFVGNYAGTNNTGGWYNAFMGGYAGAANTGDSNSFMGYRSGDSNTTGNGNSFIGYQSGHFTKTGVANAIFGAEAGYGVSDNSFSNSTLIGYRAGYGLGTGGNNILLGFQAGYTITTGAGNIVIGYNKDTSAPGASNELNIGGVLYGDLSAKTIGISTRVPEAALDIVSTGTAQTQFAQLWRDGAGVVVGSMSATGVMMAAKFVGDGSGLSGISGDNLGNHTATAVLQMGAYGVNTSSDITAARYQINGSTMVAILPGTDSIAYGVYAGTSNITGGNYNVFIGNYAGASNTTGYNSTANGYKALYYHTTGAFNTANGFQALFYNTTANYNTANGANALYFNTTGAFNTANGALALNSNTTGGANTANGMNALRNNTTGGNNTASGYQALYYNQTGAANSVFGVSAGGTGAGAGSFSSSTLVGYQAGYNLTTGSDNTFLGWQSGYNATTGAGNIVIGYDKRTSAPGASNELNIGGVLYGDLAAKTIGISTRVPEAALDIVSTGTAQTQFAQLWRDGAGVVKGSMSATGVMMAAKFVGDGSGLSGISGDNLGNHTATAVLQMGAYGVNTSSYITAASYQINGSTVVAILPGTSSLGIGVNAGRVSVGNSNAFVGSGAGYSNTTGGNNSFFGANAGYSNTGSQNSFLGFQAGYSNTGGGFNSFLGYYAGYANTTGEKNSFLGSYVGYSNTTGERNSFLGYYAGYYNQTGHANAILGSEAGFGVSGNSYSSSTIVGYRAGYGLTTGSDNTLLGWQSGYNVTTGAGNIVIGYDKRTSAPGANNELNIGGVLYGDLAAKTIGISTRVPQAALDIVSTGTAQTQFAQLWRDGAGVVKGSMSATGVMMAAKFVGDGSGLSGISAPGDNLGNHTATAGLNMAGFAVSGVSTITMLNGSIALVPPGTGGSNDDYGISIGSNAFENGYYGIGVGYGARNNNNYAVGIGPDAYGNYSSGVGIGRNAYSNYTAGVGVGFNASGNYNSGVGIGYTATSNNDYGVGVGNNASANYNYGVGVGANSTGNYNYGTGVGAFTASRSSSAALGYYAQAPNVEALALGAGANANAKRSVCIGAYCVNNATDTVKIKEGYTLVLDSITTTAAGLTISTNVIVPAGQILLAQGGTALAPGFAFSGSNGAGLAVPSARWISLIGNNSEIFGLDTNNRLRMYSAPLYTTASLQNSFTLDNTLGFVLSWGTDTTAASPLLSRKSRGSANTPSPIISGDDLFRISANGYVGGTGLYVEAARIDFTSTGTITDAANGAGGVIKFQTRAAGGNLAEQMRIDSSGNVGVSTGSPQARLDVLAAGSAQTDMAQLWRASDGVIKSSMSATGVMMAAKFVGDGSGLTGISAPGDNLGNHTATAVLQMGAYGVNTSSDITAARFQINGSTMVAILPGTGSIAYGVYAGTSNITGGNYNIFIGNSAGASNTTGYSNSFLGYAAGIYNTTGFNNSFLGDRAGYLNTTGSYNSFLGNGAGYYNTTGGSNSFVGERAGYNNTTGGSNSFLGARAGYANTTGGNNSFLGYAAGIYNTTGNNNSFLGFEAGNINITGSNNSFLGSQAGYSNTTGSDNSSLGFNAGYYNQSGSANLALGYQAGKGVINNSYSSNTLVGYQSGFALTTGSDNTFLGWQSGYNVTTGTGNIVIGYDKRTSAPGVSNELNIGGVLYGDLAAKTIGISTRVPQAALDIVSTGTAQTQFAQLWRDGGGVVKGSMSATGVMMAAKFIAPNGTLAAPAYSFAGSANTGLTYGVGTAFGNNMEVTVGSSLSGSFDAVGFYSPLLIGNSPTAGQGGIDMSVYHTVRLFNAYGNTMVLSSPGGTDHNIGLYANNATAVSNSLRFNKARGSYASPTVITTGDTLGKIDFLGHVGATNEYQNAAFIRADSVGAISDSATGIAGIIRLFTADTGSEPAERMTIMNSGNIGISTGAPQARLDVLAAGSAQTDMAQLWRDGTGAVVSSVSATGVMMAAKFVGDGSGLTGISAPGDNLGNHTATAVLQMGAYGVNTSSAITAVRYQINGSTVLAILPGDGTSLGIGVNAGKLNTTGQYNVFIGNAAGTSNTTENYNSFFGNAAGSLSTGSSNSFLGAYTGYANSGSNNSFVGYWAGRFNSTGGNNSFIGTGAGGFNETGSYNSLLGYNTGISNTTGGYNSFLGAEAGYYNTTGANNSLMGYRAGYFSAAGSANSILGYEAGYGVTLNSFSSSTLVGYRAGYGLTTGSDNTFLGWQAGYNVTTGTGNIVIGYDKRTSAPGANNELNIGGMLYGDLAAKTIGISTRVPEAALDIVSTGTAQTQFAQLWRDGAGVVKGSMSATGVMMAAKFTGDGSGLTGISAPGDNLGNHTATLALNMSNNAVDNVSSVTITGTGVTGSDPLFKVAGSTMVVLNNGKVGIGTTNPLEKLQIGSGDGSLRIDGPGSDTTASANTGIYFGDGANAAIIKHRASGGLGFDTYDNTWRTNMVVDGSGNVGIGTVGPGARLEVKQSVNDTYAVKVSSNDGTVMTVVQSNGNVGISTGAPQARLDVLAAGSAQTDMAQLWRDSGGVIVSSVSATGVMMAAKFVGDGAGLTNIPAAGVYTLAQMNALAPAAAGRLVSVSDAAAPYSYCVSTGTAAGAWVMLNQTLHCQ